MPRMRTIDQTIKELKQADPNSALTKHALRQMILKKEVPSVMVGCKYLINLDLLQAYLDNPTPPHQAPEYGKIRRID